MNVGRDHANFRAVPPHSLQCALGRSLCRSKMVVGIYQSQMSSTSELDNHLMVRKRQAPVFAGCEEEFDALSRQ